MGYTTVKDPIAGVVQFKKIGDLTADELTSAVTGKSVIPDPSDPNGVKISAFDVFNEGNVAAPPKAASNGVDLYKVKYFIRNHGNLDPVTGLLAIPVGVDEKSMPLLSWQHGTTFTKNEAPTGLMINDEIQVRPPGSVYAGLSRTTETLFNLHRFGGSGYVVAAADYNGLGDSRSPQYYVVDKPTTKATAGLISASETILKRLNLSTSGLYLTGWSQGAVNTLFLDKYLDNQDVSVGKSAHASTFSSLKDAINYWGNDFSGDPNWTTSCIPMVLGSYEKYYKIDGLMEHAIKRPYLGISKRIYKGEVDWDQVAGPEKSGEGLLGLPLTGREMLKSKFREDFKNGKGEFYEKVMENQPLTEKLAHPTRFYGGNRDTVIPPGFSIEKPVEFLGPLSEGVLVSDQATHRGAFMGLLYGSLSSPQNDAFTWFSEA